MAERSAWLFTLARWACIPFSLWGAWVAFRWAWELYGDGAGLLLPLTLWCFSLNIIAHGQLITSDVAAPRGRATTACYTFCWWLRRPTWGMDADQRPRARTCRAGQDDPGGVSASVAPSLDHRPLDRETYCPDLGRRRLGWLREIGMLAARTLIG